MDSVKAQKLQATKNYKKAQFLHNLIVYSLTAFLTCLFYSYLFWYPTMTHFFSVFLPNIYSFFLSAKFLFIVGNVIVLILVGESKLGGSQQYSSPSNEIYEEYVHRTRSLRQRSMIADDDYKKGGYYRKPDQMHNKIDKNSMNRDERSIYLEEKKQEIQGTSNNFEDVCEVDSTMEAKLEEEEEEEKLVIVASREELNRRVEDFIARVNRQRRLEERQVLDP